MDPHADPTRRRGTLVNRLQSRHAPHFKETMKTLKKRIPGIEPDKGLDWVAMAMGWITAAIGLDNGLGLAFRKVEAGRKRLVLLVGGQAYTRHATLTIRTSFWPGELTPQRPPCG